MSVTVGAIMELLEGIAPLSYALEWDNAGLLAGSRKDPVDCVLCALDLTQAVLEEAVSTGAQMIVTHHPILFRGTKNLCTDTPEGKLLCDLAQSGIALASMHTNFDLIHPGVNDALAEAIGLSGVKALEDGICMGELMPESLSAVKLRVENALGGSVRMYGSPEKRISRVAVLGGAGGDYILTAQQSGAEVFITGEIAYHRALDAVAAGMCVLEAGHAATEAPAIPVLARGLQMAANDVQYNLRVLCSKRMLFL